MQDLPDAPDLVSDGMQSQEAQNHGQEIISKNSLNDQHDVSDLQEGVTRMQELLVKLTGVGAGPGCLDAHPVDGWLGRHPVRHLDQ